ncbi:GtrA family protein [Actinoplanes sp. URMC 104]|uniref:GtrA family protein n=1 Tax=Actinoplanes sp. URMC 104 TaxID=3423409 RepID=UPI003F1D2D5B
MAGADVTRLLRYGVSGAASALTHLGLGLTLAQGLGVRPVAASAAGFAASVGVSYALQRSWVFRASTAHVITGARFAAVTAAAFALNSVVLWLGAVALAAPFVPVQLLAMAAIPAVNYVLHSRWTFRIS